MNSLKEIFRIGKGPSSSHTMGPARAAEIFAQRNPNAKAFEVTLYGSLAATGKGHMTDKAIIDVLKGKMVKRNVAIKNLEYGKIEPASGGTVRQVVTIKNGISKEVAKDVVKLIKNMKLKVTAQIMEDQVRVAGKDKDQLQAVITMLREQDLPVELQFVNFRS